MKGTAQETESTDVAIIGSSIVANLAAAFLKKKCPDLDVRVVGPANPKRPIVGESLIEPSTSFIRELGLGSVLVDNHFPKYGLSFYYKADINTPSDNRYAVVEAPFILPTPSFNLNRFTFDGQLSDHNARLGVKRTAGTVREVEFNRPEGHVLSIAPESNGKAEGGSEPQTLSARWVIDATGRSRFLAKRMGLCAKSDSQRSSFWLRLSGFNRRFLEQLDITKDENHFYDSYYCTHHFFGKGNWIWCIPMRGEDGEHIMSIGITYNPDHYDDRILNLDDFLEKVGSEHKVIADLVSSGKVEDQFQYNNYMYTVSQHYSPDGWFIVGDAGDTVDPLYSMGLVFACLQIRQIKELIERERRGECTAQLTHDFDEAYSSFHSLVGGDITRLYEVMHDGYQCRLRQHVSQFAAFHTGIPMIMGGYLTDPVGVRFFNKMSDPDLLLSRIKSVNDLIQRVAEKRKDPTTIDDFFEFNSRDTINFKFFSTLEHKLIPTGMAKAFAHTGVLRMKLLKQLGARGFTMFGQQMESFKELGQAASFWLVFRGKDLRNSRIIKKMIGM